VLELRTLRLPAERYLLCEDPSGAGHGSPSRRFIDDGFGVEILESLDVGIANRLPGVFPLALCLVDTLPHG